MLHELLDVVHVIGPVPLGAVREGVSKKKAHRIAMGFSQTGRHARMQLNMQPSKLTLGLIYLF